MEDRSHIEKHAADFSIDAALEARKRAWDVLDKIAGAIQPGMTEGKALALARSIIDEVGFEKHWHKPMVRFGTDTVRGYSEDFTESLVLKSDDIFFVDIGPVWQGYEADVGKTFVLGEDPEKVRCAKDAELLFEEMKEAWKQHGLTGAELYAFATARAKELGWVFKLDAANGHRLSEFPHHVYYKGNMTQIPWTPAPYLWMLEVQLVHPKSLYGSFYEDLLF